MKTSFKNELPEKGRSIILYSDGEAIDSGKYDRFENVVYGSLGTIDVEEGMKWDYENVMAFIEKDEKEDEEEQNLPYIDQIRISLEKYLDTLPVTAPKTKYGRHVCYYKIDERCERAINFFYVSNAWNADYYRNIKTFGADSVSRKQIKDLITETSNGDTIWNIIKKNHLKDDHYAHNDASAAFRWYVRGLSLRDAIRKAEVDAVDTDMKRIRRCMTQGWGFDQILDKYGIQPRIFYS